MERADILISIKRTLAYFDQFSYPLTAEELFDFLWQPAEKIQWREFLNILENAVTNGHCVSVFSYYLLPGREECAEKRQRSLLLVESKLALARRAAKLLGTVPFVRGIFVCNTVAAGWPTTDSDIDVLVIVQTDRLWLARLLVTGMASLCNVRRGKKYIADRICLSFYLTDSHLSLADVRIAAPDIYLTYWLYQLVPIFDEAEILEKLHSANQWTHAYIPNAAVKQKFHPDKIIILHPVWRFLKHGLEKIIQNKIGVRLENICRSFQLKRIAKQPHNIPPAVVISNTMLKFHEDDRRAEYQHVWLAHPATFIDVEENTI
ncbi:MAG: hypothetical protein A2821_04450 [Candidatus Magasanikbacteria bacterium RIFCSPHIGHO2_01_FULL_41_23]|uniref:Polymerase nucleotidyl transferase domain-containing protein n=1 Tax=Candidatus Magasanikbacteria bacterium RIFCSPLOWO2_01_FULL_40_15 TaxID=1798686 RepID=A0A1F6N4Y6_9BACT|nr:MAG: hypothetical protein A2821_04450 [Candidatus Magasanikbacteria bacterium RIFCSPHIGHO2_01_FULL_41_23]OGH67176.1 MAG: hypothetical protein A3C66_02765 [Candidatus Magasanikbacteria bacterium RIFCSPHIGHO2_02_FULL_41_35]OGH75459.1 MAG: hypothetical protein A3F22_01380 [Candidatus Magasanikbacteria bacterium RIFCSPHIGHO2_12_FULL_41_16]OGH78713.1 MAG: hypothetical protein A2983_04405 [Candidatus Magasanikbacteria bacterium RIFCSPLOWO2_01_FULL_40_15]